MPNIVDDAPAIRSAMDMLGMRPWVPRNDAPTAALDVVAVDPGAEPQVRAQKPARLTPPRCLAVLNERAANVNGVANVSIPAEWLWELLGYINSTLEPVDFPLRCGPEPG